MKPNYYAIIPADVRYDDRLTANAKLLYGEITALSNKNGKCWALNEYFSKLYNVDKRTISRWFTELKDCNYIKIQYKRNDQKKIVDRVVKIVTPRQNCPTPHDKNVSDNSIVNSNNIINNNSTKSKNAKNVGDFDEIYLKAYDHIVELFPDRNKPKNTMQKIKWLTVIERAHKIDKCNPRQLYFVAEKARNDEFWKKIFISLGGIRDSKNGKPSKLDQFIYKFGGQYFDQIK